MLCILGHGENDVTVEEGMMFQISVLSMTELLPLVTFYLPFRSRVWL